MLSAAVPEVATISAEPFATASAVPPAFTEAIAGWRLVHVTGAFGIGFPLPSSTVAPSVTLLPKAVSVAVRGAMVTFGGGVRRMLADPFSPVGVLATTVMVPRLPAGWSTPEPASIVPSVASLTLQPIGTPVTTALFESSTCAEKTMSASMLNVPVAGDTTTFAAFLPGPT